VKTPSAAAFLYKPENQKVAFFPEQCSTLSEQYSTLPEQYSTCSEQ